MSDTGEPASADTVAAWVREQMRAHDRFAHVYDASEQHRLAHGAACSVYPTGSGPLIGALAAATRPRRLLEVGTGLGYSALWLAAGAGADTLVETVEQDAGHVELARQQIAREGYDRQITVLQGSATGVLPRLDPGHGFIFWDGDPDQSLAALDEFLRLLAPGGTLVTSNLFLAQYAPDIPGLDQAAEYRHRILNHASLRTAFLPSGLALSVRAT
ncbi:MAG: O-methyltransferase [Dehalococcoidia bacterium]